MSRAERSILDCPQSRFLEYIAECDSGSGSWCMPGVECGVQAHYRLVAKVGGEKWQR